MSDVLSTVHASYWEQSWENNHGDGSDEQDKRILKLYVSNSRSISSILKIVSVKQWNSQILKLWEIQLCPGTRTFSLKCSTTPMIGCYWVFDQPSHNWCHLNMFMLCFIPGVNNNINTIPKKTPVPLAPKSLSFFRSSGFGLVSGAGVVFSPDSLVGSVLGATDSMVMLNSWRNKGLKPSVLKPIKFEDSWHPKRHVSVEVL